MKKEDINYSTYKWFDPPIQETLRISAEIRLEDRMEIEREGKKEQGGVAMVRGKGSPAWKCLPVDPSLCALNMHQ